MSSRLTGIYSLVLLVAAAALVLFRLQGPAPVDVPGRFSALRGIATVRTLLGDEAPHPVGSPANQRVRDRIVAALRDRGYMPALQRQPICNPRGECATVENIIAVLPGSASTGAVMVACHYDSVPAGPGAGDDMSGVAVALELARLAKTMERRNDIIFLIDDGEEAGLLGAEAFVRHHPLGKNVVAVINVEARGTSGPSHMFETSSNHGWLIDIMRRQLSRPSSTSIFYSIYQRLPNDTDLTVFKRASIEGVNFAFIGDPLRYHTPRDSAANLSSRTLQHHGDNAFEMLQGLVRHDLTVRGGGERTYFDILEAFLITWPTAWNLALFALATMALVTLAWRRHQRESAHFWRAVATTTGSIVSAVAAGALIAGVVASPTEFIASPLPVIFATASGAVAIVVLLRGISRSSVSAQLITFNIAALTLAGLAIGALPGAAYVGLLMAMGASAALAIHDRFDSLRNLFAATAAVLPAAFVALPLAFLLPDGMGTMTLPGVSLIAALATLPAAAFIESRRDALKLSIVPAIAAIAFLAVALSRPSHTERESLPVNFMLFADADRGEVSWLTAASTPLPPRIKEVTKWNATPFRPFRGLRGGPAFHRAAAANRVPVAPQFEIIRNDSTNDERTIAIRVRSERHAYKISLVLDAMRGRYLSGSVDGVAIPPFDNRYWRSLDAGTMRIGARGLDGDGVVIELRLRGSAPVTGYLYDTSFGVSDTKLTSLRGRAESTLQDGDVTVVKREVRF
jgi:hypothetical protein